MKLVEYIKETRAEMRHVTWPTKSQAVNYTFLVIGVSTVTALILALADKIFALGLERIILKN
jgi:preprotein translocase subunit SecE